MDPRNAGPGELDPWCRRAEKFQTQYKFLGSYLVPRVDVLVSATFQSADGPMLSANFNVPSAVAAQTLGRPLSGGQANVQVNLVEPGRLFGERINQLDLRFAKVLNFGRTRTNVGCRTISSADPAACARKPARVPASTASNDSDRTGDGMP